MYKKYFYFNSDISLSLSFIAYGQNFVPYQNPQKGFSIQVPAGWQQSAQDFYGQK